MPRTDAISCTEELWLCLHFPQLALAVFEERDAARAAVVVEQRVVHCSNRDDLEPGLAVSTANSLHADLLVLERAPAREAELLENLACLAYGFTPMVALAADNSLLLEIGSCRRLYRGINPLLLLLQNALVERGLLAYCGVAQTPKAAWLLGRFPHPPALFADQLHDAVLQRQLDALPVAYLPLAVDIIESLQQMGLTTLGALRALPEAALGKRFGADVVRYLQQLSGARADPQQAFVPAPIFNQGLTFLDGVPQRQMLLFPMKRLLQRLGDYLRARQLHCHVLRWQLYDAHQVQAEIVVELSRTQSDLAALLELSRIKLDQVTLRESVFSLSLHSDAFFETAPVSEQLFPDARDQAAAGHALFDKLRARLGSDALQRIECRESLWPERSWHVREQRVSEQKIRKPETATVAPSEFRGGAARPVWLLPQPQPLRERDGIPLLPKPLTLLRGPERVDNHWWRAEGEGEYQVRDYFVARTHDDRLCWVYREFFFPLVESGESEENIAAESDTPACRWFLHGWFA